MGHVVVIRVMTLDYGGGDDEDGGERGYSAACQLSEGNVMVLEMFLG